MYQEKSLAKERVSFNVAFGNEKGWLAQEKNFPHDLQTTDHG